MECCLQIPLLGEKKSGIAGCGNLLDKDLECNTEKTKTVLYLLYTSKRRYSKTAGFSEKGAPV